MGRQKTQNQTQILAAWLIQTLEGRGTSSTALASAQLMIAHGGGQVTGAQRFPLKGRGYYNQEKAEDAAADWVEAAQSQADGLGEDMSVFVALWETNQPVTTQPAEQSAPWRVTTAAPRADSFIPTEKGTLQLLAKLVQEQGRIITHTLPQIAQQAIGFADAQNTRALQSDERLEEARRLREEALSTRHERDMEREQRAREERNQTEMINMLKTLWPVMHTAIAKRMSGAPAPAQLPGSSSSAQQNNAPTSSEQPVPPQGDQGASLKEFWNSLDEETQAKLAGALSNALSMDQLIKLNEQLGIGA